MKVKDAMEILSELPEDAEICAQWYTKEDVEWKDDPISDEVWIKANRLMDSWEFSQMIELIEQAINEVREEE